MTTRMMPLGWMQAKRSALTLALLAGCYGWAGAQANDDCAGAINISDGALLSGQSTAGATLSPPEQDCDGELAHEDLWYKVTSGNSTSDIEITVDGGFIAMMYKQYFDGSCGTLNSLGCSFGPLTISPAPNTTYYIRVYEFNGSPATFSIQASGNIVLPVKMSNLKAKMTDKSNVLLNWNTFKEQNNQGFAIERSADGKSFNRIGFVPAQAPGGNSNNELSYRFTDDAPVQGASYYRLLQTDIDGRTALSNIVRVAAGTHNTGFTIYPNPANDHVTVEIGSAVDNTAVMTLTDISGKTHWSHKGTTDKYDVDMTAFPAGIYWLRYTSSGQTTVQKLVKN